jgi:hypothetical protein
LQKNSTGLGGKKFGTVDEPIKRND